jgi:hypothetical protein
MQDGRTITQDLFQRYSKELKRVSEFPFSRDRSLLRRVQHWNSHM